MSKGKKSVYEIDLVRNFKNPGMSIARLKYSNAPLKEKNRIINKIYNKSLPGFSFIFKGLIAKNVDEIDETKFIPYDSESSLINHLEWVSIVIKFYQKEINSYLILKNEYTKRLLKGEYIEANKKLENIQEEITYSLWGTEQALLCAEMVYGLEGKTEKMAEYAKDTKSYLVALLSDFYSSKVEISTSHTNFNHKISNFLNELSDDFSGSIVKNYLEFQLSNKANESTSNSVKSVLGLSATFSIIDLYENFLKVCIIINASNNFDTTTKEKIFTLINDLHIQDYRLNKVLLNRVTISTEYIPMMEENIDCEKIIELYTLGKYKKCIESIVSFENKYGLNFSLIKILAKSIIQSNYKLLDLELKNNIIKEKIVKPLVEIYSSINKEQNLNELLSIAKVFGDLPIRYEIEYFYLKYVYSFKEEVNDFSLKFIDSYSYIFSPGIYLEQESKTSEISESISRQLGYINTLSLLNLSDQYEVKDIPKFRIQFYKAKQISQKSSEEAASLLNKMLEELKLDESPRAQFFYYYERVALELFKQYMKMKDYYRALDLLVESYFINESLIIRMDKLALYKNLKESSIAENNLKFIILIYLVNKNDSFNIYSVLISYVESKGKNLPSELIEMKFESNDERELLNFVLANIYIKSVMKNFVYLDPKERNNERINVLEYLISQNYGNTNTHQQEIKEINKTLSIQKRIKSIDEKKIFVDIEGILKEFNSIYKERFKKYILLEGVDANLVYYDLKNELLMLSSNFNEEVKVEFKSSPERKFRYLLFKDIVDDFRVEALTNSKYGLGKFLSSRIRHGLLENTLTKSFKNHKLLSLKQNNEDGILILNNERKNEITNLVSYQNEDAVVEIENLLHSFSEKIVKKIEEVKEWIRIKDKNYPQGMFDYKLIEGEAILYLYSEIQNISDYDSFYTALTDYFWDITEMQLVEIRNRITNEIFDYFINCLDNLREQLEQMSEKNIYLDRISKVLIKDINLCKVGVKSDLNEISKWFLVRKSNEFHNFHFQELIGTNLEILKKSNKEYEKINFTENINTLIQIKGENFNYLVDVFNMWYSNAIEHSGFTGLENLTISTEITKIDKQQLEARLESDIEETGVIGDEENFKNLFFANSSDYIKILVKNSVAAEKNSGEISKIIEERIEAALDNKRSKKLISEEGGTGISKIYYIFKHNLKVNSFHSYYIDENNWFNAEIYLSVGNLKAGKEY